jgi:hypothetical protein
MIRAALHVSGRPTHIVSKADIESDRMSLLRSFGLALVKRNHVHLPQGNQPQSVTQWPTRKKYHAQFRAKP